MSHKPLDYPICLCRGILPLILTEILKSSFLKVSSSSSSVELLSNIIVTFKDFQSVVFRDLYKL